MAEEAFTYQKQAYEYVRDQIIHLGLKPGEYVTDMQIAGQLNVSRTPVREAFQRLEKEGLLSYEARKGWRVYSLTLEDIHEIFDLKIAIEVLVVRKAAHCPDKDLRQDLLDAFESMRNAAQVDRRDEWLDTDVHLHNTLFLMADNERAERITANLNDQWHRVRLAYDAVQGRTTKSVKEHEAFVKSVLEGDADQAERHLRAHLERVRDDLVHLITKVLLPYTERGF